MAILTASLAACLAVASASSAQAQVVPDFDRIAPTTADWLGAIRRLLPARVDPIAEPRYLAYVKKTINGHGQLDPAREARMLEAMAAWNETMGQSVVDILADGAGPVVVIAGMGHMLYGAGVGESVGRRSQAKQVGVLPYPLDGSSRPLPELLKELQDPASEDIALADFFRLLPQ